MHRFVDGADVGAFVAFHKLLEAMVTIAKSRLTVTGPVVSSGSTCMCDPDPPSLREVVGIQRKELQSAKNNTLDVCKHHDV